LEAFEKPGFSSGVFLKGILSKYLVKRNCMEFPEDGDKILSSQNIEYC